MSPIEFDKVETARRTSSLLEEIFGAHVLIALETDTLKLGTCSIEIAEVPYGVQLLNFFSLNFLKK